MSREGRSAVILGGGVAKQSQKQYQKIKLAVDTNFTLPISYVLNLPHLG